MSAPVVVFAIGNPSRGDDALGPVVLDRLATWLAAQGRTVDVDLIEDFQLQIEHALDLEGRALALFIDAGENTPAPFAFSRTLAAPINSHSTHAIAPSAVLQVFRQTQASEPPPAFTLCIRGESFELGEALSAKAEQHAEAALPLLFALMERSTVTDWQKLAEACETSAVGG
jgi:hydrogenase maturation protease